MHKLVCTLATGFLATSVLAQTCYDPNIGTGQAIGQDTITAPLAIGFAFPYLGATYTDIALSDHGICFLSNAGVPAPPGAVPFVYTPDPNGLIANGPVIAPFWTDTVPGTGDVYVNSTATELTITWQDVTYFGAPAGTDYTFQMKLTVTGEITFFYDERVVNNSTFGGISDNAVIGVSNGVGSVLAASVDFSTSPVSPDDTTHELFAAAETFDMQGTGFTLFATTPGWVTVSLPCASVATYGVGCVNGNANMYEEMPAGMFDLAGTTITMLRTGTSYTCLDSIPGTWMAPSAGAQVIALGDDVEETVALSGPMSIPGGTTTDLTVSSNGQISLGATGNGAGWTPDLAIWLASAIPMVSPMWHDFQPNAVGSGTISFEEVNGIAVVSWNNVFNWGQTTGETFQVQFEVATGSITIVYDPVTNNVGNQYLVGLTAGGMLADNGGHDLSTELATLITVNDVEILPLTLTSNRPVLGTNWDLVTSNIDPVSPLSVTFFGNAQGPGLPFSAIGLNAPGCSIWINTILGNASAVSVAGTSTVTIPVPNNPALTGGILTAQSICLTLLNTANLLGSNGLQGDFGL